MPVSMPVSTPVGISVATPALTTATLAPMRLGKTEQSTKDADRSKIEKVDSKIEILREVRDRIKQC